MWVCRNCAEEVEDDFDVCWNCQTAKGASAPAGAPSPRITQTASASTLDSTESPEASALLTRYGDAYLVARATNGWGRLIKIIGLVVALLLALAGLVLIADNQRNDASFALGVVVIVSGLVSGIMFYVVGVLVSAQGQILKASLDGAVNSSPFLNNKQRAKIMSL